MSYHSTVRTRIAYIHIYCNMFSTVCIYYIRIRNVMSIPFKNKQVLNNTKSADPSPFSRGRRKEGRRRHVGLHLCVIVEKQWCLTVGDPLWRSCGLGVVRGRLRDVFCARRGAGCGFGRVWTRLRCVFCPRAGACFFSFMGFRLVTSARCGGGFFAGFASGFRWCLAVLSPSPGGCCFGRVWARLRCVFCPRAGACFFFFRGFTLVTSARCGGEFFAGFASGFRWCLAVLSPSPGGCCFGRVWARLRCVFCPRAGACFFSFMGFRLVTSARCGGGFFAGFASGFRWCLAVLSPSPGGCCFGRVWARLRCVFCPRAGACFFLYGFQTCHFGTLRGRVFCWVCVRI